MISTIPNTGQLLEIAKSAHALERWLAKNSGSTSDWPVQITCDNEEDGKILADLLTNLSTALKRCPELG